MSTLELATDYPALQRRHQSLTGLLELILRRAELSPAQLKNVQVHYTEKTEFLKGCPWLRRFDLILGPQGSVSTGTTVAPLGRKHGEHDVDLVLKVIANESDFTVAELHQRLGARLQSGYAAILSPIRFGWTLDYAEEERFHFDIIATIPAIHQGILMAGAADTKTGKWKPTNPEEYAKRFLKLADQLPLIEAKEYQLHSGERMVLANNSRSVTVEPLPDNTVLNLPLQRNVQLSKRVRDVWFAARKQLKQRTPSIIVTTMMWYAYESYVAGQTFPSMFRVFEVLAEHLDDPNVLRVTTGAFGRPRYSLINPTVPGENLVERWNDPERAQEAGDFFAWVRAYRTFLKALASAEGMHRLQPVLTESLGSVETAPVFRDMIAALNPNTRSSAVYHSSATGLTSVAAVGAIPSRPHTFHGSSH